MKTEQRLALALRELMVHVPLDEISVTSITDKCGLNRKSFYYYFHDIYDLLTLVFLGENIPDIDYTKNVDEMIKVIYRYYNRNRKFLNATLSSAGKELLNEFLFNVCYRCLLRFVNEISHGKKIKPNDRKLIARYYGSAYAQSIINYFATHKSDSVDGLMSCFSFQNDDFLEKAVQNLIIKREKLND